MLFLDEPTTGLDPEARADLWAEIGGLARDEGLTVLLTTHYLEEADRLADHLVIVDRGRIVAEGTAEQLKASCAGTRWWWSWPTAPGRAARLGGVREVTVEGRTLRARVDDGARAVPAVLAELEAAGLVPAPVTVARPSLDDVYLRHTGRSFSADAASARPGRSYPMSEHGGAQGATRPAVALAPPTGRGADRVRS